MTFRANMFQSLQKLKGLECLIQELAKPVVDIPEISQYSSAIISKIQQQHLAVIPKLVESIKKRNEPLVLEIVHGRNRNTSLTIKKKYIESVRRPSKRPSEMKGVPTLPKKLAKSNKVVIENEFPKVVLENASGPLEEEEPEEVALTSHSVAIANDPETLPGPAPVGSIGVPPVIAEKQFEIIFSDSTRPTDLDEGDQHIIHSITERAATPTPEGTVNVPDSFPLFQIIHNSGEELPQELRQEIVRLIKEANPKLNLNSITFKLKSPQTVEIIANVNS